MNMTPKVRKQITRLNTAFAEVEHALEGWSDTSVSKERALSTLNLKREALNRYVARNNVPGILALSVPRVIGTNVIWNIVEKA
jgi:septation ring formation regulator EzrA